jgi:two-component system cell cycle sensor histidine kinase/response regulator CckA
MSGTSEPVTCAVGSPVELIPRSSFPAAVARRDDAALTVDQQLRCIIEHTSDIIGIVDGQGRLQFHSPSAERLLGYAPAMLHGRPVAELLHHADLQRASEFFAQQLTPGAVTRTVDLRIRHSDGSWLWFSIAATPMTRTGERGSIVINGRDVTQKRLLEAQLEQANRLNSLGRLAATVAHEFNNVLMGIQPFADLIQRPNVTTEMIAKSARYIAGSVARGKRVALDILRFTNPATPTLDLVHVQVWWEQLAPEIEATLGDHIRLTVSVDPTLFIRADPLQLSQVFANVINNARDAMPKGGDLEISARRFDAEASFPFGVLPPSRGYVHFAVTDTGSGIPDNIRGLVFDPLFTTKENGGTGLGLAVTHQVLRAHHGHVFVESELGRGTTFHIFIPSAETSERGSA